MNPSYSIVKNLKTYIIKSKDIEPKTFPGRILKSLITKSTVNAHKMTLGLVWIQPGSIIKPCHAHAEEEESFYILKGKALAWIDGNIIEAEAGDCIFFPQCSKHMVKNIGTEVLEALWAFAPPSDPSKYEFHPEIEFPDEK